MSEINNLLNELRNMKSNQNNTPQNSKELWEKIGNKDWQGAGFNSAEEMQQFIVDNPYSNL